MAHAGQEQALGLQRGLELVGAFRDLLLQVEIHLHDLLLQCLAFGDIQQDAMGAQEAAFVVALDAASNLHGNGAPIGPAQEQPAFDTMGALELLELRLKLIPKGVRPIVDKILS